MIFIIILLLAVFLFVPGVVLQFAPGFRTFLVLFFLFSVFCIWQYQLSIDYRGDDRIGFGRLSLKLLTISIIVGAIIKIRAIFKNWNADDYIDKPIFKRRDRYIALIFMVAFVSFAIWQGSGICGKNFRKLSSDELAASLLNKAFPSEINYELKPIYYRIGRPEFSMLGVYRTNVTFYWPEKENDGDRAYTVSSQKLNACGDIVTEGLRMGATMEEVAEIKKYYRELRPSAYRRRPPLVLIEK